MANVNYISYPKLKATDYNGNALVGGTVTTYLNNTTTPAPTYTDYTGTVLNANPFTLPANGEMSIWLVNGTTYTIVVKDAMGNTIDTINGISASSGLVINGDIQIFDFSITDDNNNKYIKFTTTTSAVNYLTITDGATGHGPTIGVGGTDGNIDLNLLSTNTGKVNLGSATSSGIELLGNQPLLDNSGNILESFTKATSAVNYLNIANAATGSGPTITATGTDTNIPVNITATNGVGAAGTGAGQINLPGQVTLKNDGTGSGVIASPIGKVIISKNQVTVGNTTPTGTLVTIDNSGAGSIISGSGSSFTLGNSSSNTPMTIGSGAGITILSSPIDEAKGTDVASASSVSLAGGAQLGLLGGNYINITGTTTITSFVGNVQAGARRRITFTGALVLTYNSTSLILPGAANITTAAGDTAEFTSLGSNNWKCTQYTRASGHALVESSGGSIPGVNGDMIYNQSGAYGADTSTTDGSGNLTMTSVTPGNMKLSGNTLASTTGVINLSPNGSSHIVANAAMDWTKGTDIASASTTNIGAATGNYVNVTGTTTITAFDSIQAGTLRIVTFTGILVLTYNGTTLILPTAANITTAAGDVAEFISLGSSNWKCTQYTRASGAALSGTVTIPGSTSDLLYNNAGSLGADTSTTDGSGNIVTTSVKGGNLKLSANSLTASSGNVTLTPASGSAVVISTTPLNLNKGTDIASASTVALGTATGNYVNVTGTTTITAFDTVQAGTMRTVTFTGILTLTYNATTLILPSAANITTAAGDTAEFVSLGSGNWKCVDYTRASGAALVGTASAPGSNTDILYNNSGVIGADTSTTDGSGNLTATSLVLSANFKEAKAGDIASASTVNIGAAAGNYLHITGTTTITAFDTVQAGVRKVVKFTGILTLTHNSTSLILPTSTNITTAAGDRAEFISEGSGNWICTDYTRASGAALSSSSSAPGSNTDVLYNSSGSIAADPSFTTDGSGNVGIQGTLTLSGGMKEQATSIASASTTNIGAANGNYVDVTGTTTITAFDTIQNGTRKILRFSGVLTLTHNATSLILPGSANITTANGDTATFVSLGSGNWRCTQYQIGQNAPGFASKATVQTATSTTQAPSVSTTQYHPGVAQAWGYVTGAGSILASYNVASVSNTSAGFLQVTMTNGMSSSNYVVIPSGTTSGGNQSTEVESITSGTVFTLHNYNLAGSFLNPTDWSFVVFGSQ